MSLHLLIFKLLFEFIIFQFKIDVFDFEFANLSLGRVQLFEQVPLLIDQLLSQLQFPFHCLVVPVLSVNDMPKLAPRRRRLTLGLLRDSAQLGVTPMSFHLFNHPGLFKDCFFEFFVLCDDYVLQFDRPGLLLVDFAALKRQLLTKMFSHLLLGFE